MATTRLKSFPLGKKQITVDRKIKKGEEDHSGVSSEDAENYDIRSKGAGEKRIEYKRTERPLSDYDDHSDEDSSYAEEDHKEKREDRRESPGSLDPKKSSLCRGIFDDQKWEEMYKRLQIYKKKHGNCDVPAYYVEDKTLGYWVRAQRKSFKHKALPENRKVRLESMGIQWQKKKSDHEQRWEVMFERLQSYRKQHGDCDVTIHCTQDEALYSWVRYQRQKYKSKELEEEKQQRLDSVGFKWQNYGVHDKRWDDMFQQLVQYRRKHGDCLVTRSANRSLSHWVMNQRQKYKTKQITKDRQDRLMSIDFEWVVSEIEYEEKWAAMFGRLKRYKEKHGNCQVPVNYAEDKALGEWVQKQRTSYKLKKLQEDRKTRLISIGFQWSINACKPKKISDASNRIINDQRWKIMLKRLEDFRKQNGEDFVPKVYDL